MSNRKYPRLDSIRKKPPQKLCACCGEPGVETVWVQWSYMRGEDEPYAACHKHGQMARKQFDQFIAALRHSPHPAGAVDEQT